MAKRLMKLLPGDSVQYKKDSSIYTVIGQLGDVVIIEYPATGEQLDVDRKDLKVLRHAGLIHIND